MKKLFFLFAVLVGAVIVWLWPSQQPVQSLVDQKTTAVVTTTSSEHQAVSTSASVQSSAPASEASQAKPADQMLFNTKSDPNVQPIDPDTDPANQSVKVN